MRVLRVAGTIVAWWIQGTSAPATWTAVPSRPSVGDTVWLERIFTLPAGWRLRPGRLQSSEDVEALADAVVSPRGADWVVRYPVAAWAPGAHSVTLPPIWRLGPAAQADSVPGGRRPSSWAASFPRA